MTDTLASPPLFLEDLYLGQHFSSGSQEVTAEAIKTFAKAFDPQPFHTDEAAAENTFFAGLAASGWHVAALTMKLLVGERAFIANGIVGAGGEISWPRPTRPGDILSVDSEVTEIAPSRSRPDRGIVTLRSETRNQRGEIAQVLTSKLVVMRRVGGLP
ncbi:MaoC family dehydratase [Rhodoblastus sp.]|uniref:MaoC family dehydratase n=1 Tax=Rhodoblastus sp. TaxID=1962975 RepID=UPI0026302F00|nr:MaoC family dehydratase [Rhodoblastus sp.]